MIFATKLKSPCNLPKFPIFAFHIKTSYSLTLRVPYDIFPKDNNNLKIIVYCFDESSILLNRAMDNLTIFKRQMGTELQNNNIELQFNFSQISLKESIRLPESSIDILIAQIIYLHAKVQ